jgi:hypothetical protein
MHHRLTYFPTSQVTTSTSGNGTVTTTLESTSANGTVTTTLATTGTLANYTGDSFDDVGDGNSIFIGAVAVSSLFGIVALIYYKCKSSSTGKNTNWGTKYQEMDNTAEETYEFKQIEVKTEEPEEKKPKHLTLTPITNWTWGNDDDEEEDGKS